MPARRAVDASERRARLAVRHRHVAEARTDDVVALTDHLVALHSTDPVSVHLSATARMRNPALAALAAALYEQRSLRRQHAMRRTLWVFGPEAARLAHHACTVALLAREQRVLTEGIEGAGRSAAWLAAARAEVLAVLAEAGPLTAREVGRRLPHLAVPVEVGTGRLATPQAAHTRLLLVLGFEGAVVRAQPAGSWVSGQYRWAAATSWFPDGAGAELDRRSAAAGLARRWLWSFGPAAAADLRWWAGWTAATTTAALADTGAVEVELDGQPGVALPDDVDPAPAAAASAVLLPGLDPSTMGWKRRDWYLDPEHAPTLFDRYGNGGPTAWVDGRIVGGWAQRRDGSIALRLLADVGAEATAALERAAHDLETLLGGTRFTPRFPAPLQAELVR